MTLSELKLQIENMYDQLDKDVIDDWDIDGLELYDSINDVTIVLKVDNVLEESK